jgi:hypothetical protein
VPRSPEKSARAAALRVFAGPAARATLAIAAGVLGVALLAGAVRLLPILLAPGVPLRLWPVLGRSALAVALEAALFVSPPLGFALAAARLVERGEARALFALGVSPLGLVGRSAPALLAAALAAALAAGLWGREAHAPGRAARDLLDQARVACLAAPPPAVAEVPVLGVTWVCLPGEPPRAVGPLPPAGAFAAASITLADDLAALAARDLDLVLPAAADRGAAHLHAASASIRGLAPLGRPSNLTPAARVLVLAFTAPLLAAVAALLLLRAAQGRVAAAVVGASGPAASLLAFSALERGPTAPFAYLAVPVAGLAALTLAAALARRRAP